MRFDTQHATVTSGEAWSDAILIKGAEKVAFMGTLPTSGSLRLRGAWDTTSASSAPVSQPLTGVSSVWNMAVQSGVAFAADVTALVGGFSHMRFEATAALIGVGSLAVITKF